MGGAGDCGAGVRPGGHSRRPPSRTGLLMQERGQRPTGVHYRPDARASIALRKQRGAETVYVYKDPGDYLEDFELACSAFIVNMLGFRIPKDNDFTKEIFDELVNRNKSKIFYMIFEGDIL